MLVTWRYRKRKSLIQWFDPRAWIIFYGCFLASTLFFWDVRFLLFFLVIALATLFTSGVRWSEIRRAFLFIGGFVFFFALLTFLTGRGGAEVYQTERLIREFRAPFTLLGWQPVLQVTVERIFFAAQPIGARVQHRGDDHPHPLLAAPFAVWDYIQGAGAAG